MVGLLLISPIAGALAGPVDTVATLDSAIVLPDVLERELPPLDSLIKAAQEYSPVLKLSEAEIARFEAELGVRKREWTNRIFTDAGTFYANNYNALTVASNGGGYESVSLGAGNVLRAGVTARLSLFDVIGRGQLIERAEAEKQMSEFKYDKAKQELSQYITQLYTELKLAKKLVIVYTETYYTLNAQLEMAEKEFRQGEIHITELARITSIKSKAEVSLEQAQANYENLYYQMEIIVGKSLESFLY